MGNFQKEWFEDFGNMNSWSIWDLEIWSNKRWDIFYHRGVM